MQADFLAALGGTYAYDEFRGDFARARTVSEAWLDEAEKAQDRASLADGLLSSAVVLILQGELAQALDRIERAEGAAQSDPVRLLRAQTLRLYATYERFNTLPDGAGAGAIEITARWRGAPDLQADDARWRELYQTASDPVAQQEAWLVYGYLCNLKSGRYLLESSRFTPAGDAQANLLRNVLATPAQLSDAARGNGLLTVAAYADLCSADLCRRAREVEAAAQFLQRAEATYLAAGDPVGVALCKLHQADWLCAPFSSPIAWNLAFADSSSEGSHLQVGLESEEFTLPTLEDRAEASALYEEARGSFAAGEAPRGAPVIELRSGYLAMLSGDWAGAVAAIERARTGFERVGDWRGVQLAEIHRLLALVGEGKVPGIEERAEAVGAWGRTTGSFSFTLGLGFLLNRWGRHCLIRRGDYEGALSGYRAARGLFESLGAESNAVQNIVDDGTVHQAIGNRSAALTFFEEALDRYAEQIETRPPIAQNLRQRSVMLSANVFQLSLLGMEPDGMDREAARLTSQVEGIPLPPGDIAEAFKANEASLAALLAGDSEVALEQWNPGLENWALHQLAASFIEMARVLVPLYRSRAAREAGKDERADSLLAEAEIALETVGEGQVHFLRTSVLVEQKRMAEAADAYRQHLEAGGASAGFLGTLTDLMAEAGSAGESEARLQQIRTHEQAFTTFVRVQDYRAARTHLEALESLAGDGWWTRDAKPWGPLSDIGELYDGLGDLPKALDAYERAIAELEGRRSTLSRDELKTSISADKGAQYLYFLAAKAAFKDEQHARAFNLAERGKSRGLLDLMAGSAVLTTLPEAGGAAMQAWRELSGRLALRRGLLATERARPQPDATRIQQITAEILEEEAVLRQAEARLAEAAPEFHDAVSAEAPTLTLEAVAAELPPDALLLEYFFLGDEFLAWAVDHKGLVRAEGLARNAAELNRTIAAYHAACEGRRPVVDLAASLAAAFLEPVDADLDKFERLIIVPHGTGHRLPFHALPHRGRPISESHVVSYLPSASALQFLRPGDRPNSLDSILAVGNPTGDLPAAGAEAAYVAGLFGQEALLGDEAVEAAVRPRLSGAPLLHFATHGRLSEEAPLTSSLLLANGDELTVYELAGLRLRADLVVLSACSTGQGETTGGDDVLGLTRGLLAAGARSAVVSLWRVDDLSTSLFMGHFYRRLRSGELAAEALRSAQSYLRSLKPEDISGELKALRGALEGTGASRSARDVRRTGRANYQADYSHPYYWAPFILIG